MNYLSLVNKQNKIKESYLKNMILSTYTNIFNETISIEKESKEEFIKLKEYLEKKNIEVGIRDSYRDMNTQKQIYDYYLNKEGIEYCNNYVAIPGYSEHHTGLAIDITIKYNGKFLKDDEELICLDDEKYKEIHKNLSKFGFILRYPKNKEKITGYNYEPWHIRYVGKIPAKIISENDLTLEEYLNEFGGVLVVNKEKDMTSFDVVREVSKILGIKKIGHTGTLDPLAEGVLVLTIGKYTKLGEDLTSLDKEYIAKVKQGILTDTLDITGKILEENSKRITNIKEVLKSFKKTYMQEVPKYSAVKVNGKKLYEYARKNEEVELPKKEVTIKEIKLIEKDENTFTFKTSVSKGTYIRSLIRDIGESSNTLMTMTNLIRTRQGKFRIEDSYKLNDITNGDFNILKIEDILDYEIIDIDEKLLKKIENGVVIDNAYNIKDKVIFRYNGKKIAIYTVDNKKLRMYLKLC
ncbi:MAG: tRNA pseudouridine(55) synthase TruB [Bacilli bacterium]|nr:tRNA pseudouridine(55) synthase TruB [Bacilli bacterium]